jgi:hypothetical protein
MTILISKWKNRKIWWISDILDILDSNDWYLRYLVSNWTITLIFVKSIRKWNVLRHWALQLTSGACGVSCKTRSWRMAPVGQNGSTSPAWRRRFRGWPSSSEPMCDVIRPKPFDVNISYIHSLPWCKICIWLCMYVCMCIYIYYYIIIYYAYMYDIHIHIALTTYISYGPSTCGSSIQEKDFHRHSALWDSRTWSLYEASPACAVLRACAASRRLGWFARPSPPVATAGLGNPHSMGRCGSRDGYPWAHQWSVVSLFNHPFLRVTLSHSYVGKSTGTWWLFGWKKNVWR